MVLEVVLVVTAGGLEEGATTTVGELLGTWLGLLDGTLDGTSLGLLDGTSDGLSEGLNGA